MLRVLGFALSSETFVSIEGAGGWNGETRNKMPEKDATMVERVAVAERNRTFTRYSSTGDNARYTRCLRRARLELPAQVIVRFPARPALPTRDFSTKPFEGTRDTPLRAPPCVSNEFTFDDPPWTYRHFLSVCARARSSGQHVGRDSLQRQMLDHLPVAPSRYETRDDYTLSAHRGQGRTVLPGFFRF